MRPNPSTALAEVIVDELVRNGVTLFVISPGSRSAALAIAAAHHPGAETTVVIDERSAAFRALGRAKSGQGSAVIATSGSAPANWFPAVVEADASLTPLLLLSADRPPEMQGVGANQTIDQSGMFGKKVRASIDIEAPDGSDSNPVWREAVCRAVSESRGGGGRPGPVHLNVAFREPTVPVTDDGRTVADPYTHPIAGKGEGVWCDASVPPPPDEIPRLSGRRGLVIAGDGDYDRDELASEAARLGWPVLATALSGLRGGDAVDAYHHMLAGPVPDSLHPEIVVAIGATGPSDRLDGLVAMAGSRVRVDRWGRHIDPRRDATIRLAADPVALLRMIESEPDPDWGGAWRSAQVRVRDALASEIMWGTGAAVVTALDRVGLGCLVAGSSLPVREVDAHLRSGTRVIANRGASGIDGVVSVALGVAGAVPATLLLAGDLSLLHDSNGFLSEAVPPLVTVVLNNGGGGLFDSLPTAAHAPSYERLFVTPPERDFSVLARLHGLDHELADSSAELTEAVRAGLVADRASIVEVRIDRATDLAARRRLDSVAASAVDAER